MQLSSPKSHQLLFSALLLVLATMAFGFFLHDYDSSPYVWIAAIAYIILECSVLSIAWKSALNFLLLGFKSAVGYSVMALVAASFAVVLVVWIKVTSYFLMMLAAALLLKIKLHTTRSGNIAAFIILLGASLTGLFISWLPLLISTGHLPF